MPAAGEKAEGIAHGAQKQDAGSVSISAEDSVTDITSKTSNDDKPELACSDKPQAECEHACAPELENKSGQTFDEDHKNKNEEPVTDKGESAVQAMNDATADKIPATTPTLKRARNDDEPEAEKKVRSATSDETQEKSPPARTQPAFAAFATRPKDPATPSSSVGFSAFSSASKPFEKASGISALAEKSDKWTEAPPAAPTEQAKTDNVVRIKSVRLPEVDQMTGEEGEKTTSSARAKLYHMVENQWKERGRGVVKINVNDAGAARLVMRAEGVLRVVLNVQLFPGMKCGHEQDVFIRFVAMEKSGLVHLALKVRICANKFGNSDEARSFYSAIKGHIPAKE